MPTVARARTRPINSTKQINFAERKSENKLGTNNDCAAKVGKSVRADFALVQGRRSRTTGERSRTDTLASARKKPKSNFKQIIFNNV